MLTKTLIGTATAIAIAVGSLAAMPSTASASGNGYNNGWVAGPSWGHHYQPKPQKICKPVYRKIKWWDYWGHPHWKKIRVGYKCEWVYPNKKRPHRRHWNPAY